MNRFKVFLDSLADFFFPPQCLLCRGFILTYKHGHFCIDCLEKFSFSNGPMCLKCGILFKSQNGGNHLCGRCIAWKTSFDRARALGTYEGVLRKAIHSFKYDKESMLANPLGKLLSEYGSRLLNKEEYNLIIPVPLHPQRLRQRGFNQSLMLAKKISEAWQVKVCAECLKRIKWTIPQTMLPVNERQRNVKGAFSCSDSAVRGKKVLLVDDVYTSGSTVNECANVLKKHGVLQVDVLILARTT